MGDLNSFSNERISAMVDGDLQSDECGQILDRLREDAQSLETWHVYQVVGDVLRSPELAPTRGGVAFWEKLEQRLALEPDRPHIALNSDRSTMEKSTPVVMANIGEIVANESVFHWKVLAGVACTVLVSVVGSGLWTQTNSRISQELASVKPAAAVVVMETPVGSMLRDPRLDELMAAHRQLGGHSALQVPAGFLRNATYEGTGR